MAMLSSIVGKSQVGYILSRHNLDDGDDDDSDDVYSKIENHA